MRNPNKCKKSTFGITGRSYRAVHMILDSRRRRSKRVCKCNRKVDNETPPPAVLVENNQAAPQYPIESERPQVPVFEDNDPNERLCWICHDNDGEDHEWIAACRCIGSIKYTHHLCLLTWIHELEISGRPVKCTQCLYPYRMRGGLWAIERRMQIAEDWYELWTDLGALLASLVMRTNFIANFLWFILFLSYLALMWGKGNVDMEYDACKDWKRIFVLIMLILPKLEQVISAGQPRWFGFAVENSYMGPEAYFDTLTVLITVTLSALGVCCSNFLGLTSPIVAVILLVISSGIALHFIYMYKVDIKPRVILSYT